jgi:septal ring factor EnvC (AmiA/AmiB activator)
MQRMDAPDPLNATAGSAASSAVDPAIEGEIAALEQRVMQMADLVRRLRGENATLLGEMASLREQNTHAQSENAALRVKVDNATQRLQRLLERLPEEAA